MPLSVNRITPSVMHSVTGTASHMPCGKMNIGIRINAGTRNIRPRNSIHNVARRFCSVADKRFGSQGEKHCCQYATDGSGSETNPEGSSHTVAIACTIIETDDRLGYMFCNPLAAKVQHFGELVTWLPTFLYLLSFFLNIISGIWLTFPYTYPVQ